MKKVLIGVIVIAIPVIIYFICGSSETSKSDKAKKTLLSDTAHKTDNRGQESDDEDETSDDDQGETEKKTNADEVKAAPENSVVYTVVIDGETKVFNYKAIASFKKISISDELNGYVANFAENFKDINLQDENTFKHVISMLLPSDVAPGSFNERSSNFMFQYFGTEGGKIYTLNQASSFTVTITEWGGPGGRAKGTFSGELKADEATGIAILRNGSFDIGIQ